MPYTFLQMFQLVLFCIFLSCQESSDQRDHQVDSHGDAYTLKGKKYFHLLQNYWQSVCYVMSLALGSRNAGWVEVESAKLSENLGSETVWGCDLQHIRSANIFVV